MSDHKIENLALSVIKNRDLDDQADYLSRGRSFLSLTDNDLKQRFVAAYRQTAKTMVPSAEMIDLYAELQLRSMPIPEDEIADATRELPQRIKAEIENEGFPASIQTAVSDYLQKRKGN